MDINGFFQGGGYFRLTPLALVKHWTKSSDYVMTYFHPRDFDPKQPIIRELSNFRKFKSYVGLISCMNKLKSWTADFDFIDLASADELIDWDKAPLLNYEVKNFSITQSHLTFQFTAVVLI